MKNEISRKKYRQVGHARDVNRIGSSIPKGILPCSAIGTVLSIAFTLLLGFIMAAILYRTADPARYIVPTAFSVLYISALIGGFFASKVNGGSALLCGLLTGAMLLALTFIISLLVSSELSSDYGIIENISLRAALIVCTILGAFIGITKQHSKKQKKKNHKKR